MFKIKTRLICILMAAAMTVCALTACGDSGESTFSAEWTPHKFGVEDTEVNGVKLGMTIEEVKAAIGNPDKEENITEDQFIYGEHINLSYGKMFLSFYDINEGDDIRLGSISSDSPEVKFAEGLHAGSTKEEVLAAFAQDDNPPDLIFYGDKFGRFIYGDFTDMDFMEKKPTGAIENAYIQDRDAETEGYYMIIYHYYNPLKWQDDGSSYTGDYYQLVFYLDSKSDKVTSVLLEHNSAM